MRMEDYLKIAKEFSLKKYNKIDDNFVLLGFKNLIDKTALSQNMGDFNLFINNLDQLTLERRLANDKTDPVYQTYLINKGNPECPSINLGSKIVSSSILSYEDKDLLASFNEAMQESESFTELFEKMSAADIIKCVNFLDLSASDQIPFRVFADPSGSLEKNEFGYIAYPAINFLKSLEYENGNQRVKSNIHTSSLQDVIPTIVECFEKEAFPIDNSDKVDGINFYTFEKIAKVTNTTVSNSLTYEDIMQVINKNPYLEGSLLEKMFTSSDITEIVKSYYDTFEFNHIQNAVDLHSEHQLEVISLPEFIEESGYGNDLIELMETIFEKHPEIEYHIHEVEVIDKAGIDPYENHDRTIGHLETFYATVEQESFCDGSSFLTSNMINEYGAETGLYVRTRADRLFEENVLFVSKNQFFSNMIIECEKHTDSPEGFLDELVVKDILISATANLDEINATFDSLINYSISNKMILRFTMNEKPPIGNMNRDRMMVIIEDKLAEYEESLLYTKQFGPMLSRKFSDNENAVDMVLTSQKSNYNELLSLSKILKKEAETTNLVGFSLEKRLEEISNDFKKNNPTQKI